MPLEAFAVVLMLVALAAIVYGPWQSYCTDAGRQKLFELRDDLFDMARAGDLSFDDRQYKTIRMSIEQNIRYAHRLTIWRFLVIYLHMVFRNQFSQRSELTQAIDAIQDDKVRKTVRELSMRATRVTIEMMMKKAPVFMVALFILKTILWGSRLFNGAKGVSDTFRRWCNSAGETIQIEAERVRA